MVIICVSVFGTECSLQNTSSKNLPNNNQITGLTFFFSILDALSRMPFFYSLFAILVFSPYHSHPSILVYILSVLIWIFCFSITEVCFHANRRTPQNKRTVRSGGSGSVAYLRKILKQKQKIPTTLNLNRYGIT